MNPTVRFSIYRYDPESGQPPQMQDAVLNDCTPDMMLLEALRQIKVHDESFTFRYSCGEGVCGSDAININGRNGLACTTPLAELKQPITLRPLPSMPVIRDLVVDLSAFYQQYRAIKPYLIRDEPGLDVEHLQSPEDRDKLDGLYECILCGCCTTACPSFWWNPDKFRGPAALLQSYRFLADSRDQATEERLAALEDPYSLFRCHTIMNCVDVCPKHLNPTQAIGNIKKMLVKGAI